MSNSDEIDPEVLAELANAVDETKSGAAPMIGRFTRLPADLDAAINEYVATVPGLNRSMVIRLALAKFFGRKPRAAKAPGKKPGRPTRSSVVIPATLAV